MGSHQTEGVNGLQVPIETFGGKILDGRRRYLACQRIGVDPTFKEVSPPDPVSYVLSLNLHRRQLSVSQLAMVGAKAREVYEAQAKERQKEATIRGNKTRVGKESPAKVLAPELAGGQTRDIIGAAVGVGGTAIDRATSVLKHGQPELIQAVEEGRIPVYVAARIAKGEESPRQQKPKHESNGREEKAPEGKGEIELLGKGVFLANEAINRDAQLKVRETPGADQEGNRRRPKRRCEASLREPAPGVGSVTGP